MALPALSPITAADLPAFCDFLGRHLDPGKTPEAFRQGLSSYWGPPPPNHGFLIRAEGELVGGIGAIYAERTIAGHPERFCNITSWCVLEPYRTQSMRLALALVNQPGYQFTDLTPTEVVAKSLQFLKFKPLDGSRCLMLNLPFADPRVRAVADPGRIPGLLPPEVAQVYRDHQRFPWLRHLALGGAGGDWCLVTYKRKRFKGLPSAEVLAVSDGELFLRRQRAFGRRVLLREGLITTRIESRLLPAHPPLAKQLLGYRDKMFRSDRLPAAAIDNLYSELVALDL